MNSGSGGGDGRRTFSCSWWRRAIYFGIHDGSGLFHPPFYDPKTLHVGAVLGGTSIAVLTYIGFDGISTLSEEVEDPRRNILFATVGTCIVVGILSAIEVYAAQLVWPTALPFKDIDTAFVEVARAAPGNRCLRSS